MCGIVGFEKNNVESSKELIKSLCKLIQHRGPDDTSFIITDKMILGHTRLAIIDINNGKQPFSSEKTHLIANGEIYNYTEITNELQLHEKLKTESDCELPLHLWEKNSENYVKKLRGMYAIAIDDIESKQLILSRDPFGIKPLYYTKIENRIFFASEPQVFIKSGLIIPTIQKEAREELLQTQFTMGNKTIYNNIHRVLPGETLIFSNGVIKKSVREPAIPFPIKRKKTTEEIELKNLEKVLIDSVSHHLQSDVPYGVFLSGGIDSSIIMTLASRLTGTTLPSFTAGFDTVNTPDEREKAKKIATLLHLDSNHDTIEINEAMVWENLPRIISKMDDPCADYAIIPTWFLAKHASSQVKVILSGEGGDELFGGYGRYRSFIRHPLLGGRKMRRNGIFDSLDILRERPISWRNEIAIAEKNAKKIYRDRLSQAQYIDCVDWLPHDLLLKLDRCLMTHGIEGRTPFLDKVVSNYAFSLPNTMKVRSGYGKWILRKWLSKNLQGVDAFSRKQGFTVPISRWIKNKSDLLGKLVSKQAGICEIADSEKVMALFNALQDNKKAGSATWSLLFYAVWHQHHILGKSPETNIFDFLS